MTGVEGMFAGTSEIKLPSGIVADADRVANPARLQLLIASWSEAPTLSVITKASGADALDVQGSVVVAPNKVAVIDTETPLV